MYDPMNPPDAGIPADPLPDDLPEGDSGEVTDEGGVLVVDSVTKNETFESFEAIDYQENEDPPQEANDDT